MVLLEALLEIIKLRPGAAGDSLRRYYKLVAGYCREVGGGADGHVLELLQQAIVAPLTANQATGMFPN